MAASMCRIASEYRPSKNNSTPRFAPAFRFFGSSDKFTQRRRVRVAVVAPEDVSGPAVPRPPDLLLQTLGLRSQSPQGSEMISAKPHVDRRLITCNRYQGWAQLGPAGNARINRANPFTG